MSKETRSPKLSRRSLLAATAIGSTGAVVAAGMTLAPQVATEAAAQDAVAGMRRSVTTLSPSGRTMSAYRRGVAVMKSRPFSDPTSWSYQGAIHGFNGLPPVGLPQDMVDNLSRCSHRDSTTVLRHFLPWHRLYLHFFERIVRDASGDPDFMLPYWNYSVVGGERLPVAFRWPSDFTNPLYDSRRNDFWPRVNRGEAISFTATDDRQAMSQRSFNRFSDAIEGTPHGSVHVAVGGQGGLMSAFPTAALDPIFWLHHCNVDRMWSTWLRDQPGASNPTNDPAWMNAEFSFFDETGTRQTMSAAQTVDTDTLGYQYDDPRPVFGGFAPFVMADASESGVVAETLAASESITLSGSRKSVAAEAQGEAAESGSAELFVTDLEDLESRPVLLRMKGISFDEVPGILYEIYVNLPEGEDASPRGPYYAGLLAPFGFEKEDGVVDIDITGVLNRQIEAGEFLGGIVKVDFMPSGLPDNGEESGIVIPPLEMESIEIVRE